MEDQKESLVQLANQIEQMAIQFGIPTEDAGMWTETFFQKYHAENGIDQDLNKVHVYRRAYEQLSKMEPILSRELFLFEEDNLLLERLTDLPGEMKSVILLSRFHKLSIEELGCVIDLSEHAIEDLEREGIAQFQDPLIEKKLSLLQTSFARLRPAYRYDHLTTRQPDAIASMPEKQVKYKKPIYLWAIGILSLAAISYFWYTTTDEYKADSSTKFIAKLEKSFEKEYQDRLEQIGLTPLVERESSIAEFIFGKDVPSDFDMFIFNQNRILEKEGMVNKKDVRKEYDAYIEQIKLPSELAEELISHPTTKNWEESEQFMERYMEKLSPMIVAYKYELTSNNYPELSNLEGVQDIQALLKKQGSLSVELKNVLKGMESQNITLASHPGYLEPTPVFGSNKYSEQLIHSLHPDFGIYIKVYQNDFYKAVYSPSMSLDEAVDYLAEMETVLVKSDRSKNGPQYLSGMYTWLLASLLGIEERTVVNSDRRVKKEYRDAWRRIASLGSDSPAASIVTKIVSEMEEDDWYYSPSYEELKGDGFYPMIYQAMSRLSKQPE